MQIYEWIEASIIPRGGLQLCHVYKIIHLYLIRKCLLFGEVQLFVGDYMRGLSQCQSKDSNNKQ
jgi:hypothetical protein